MTKYDIKGLNKVDTFYWRTHNTPHIKLCGAGFTEKQKMYFENTCIIDTIERVGMGVGVESEDGGWGWWVGMGGGVESGDGGCRYVKILP